MAGFHTKTFSVHDDYMTPKYAWNDISQYIPKDKIIWEAFYGDGNSGIYLRELGFNVIHEPIDFFQNNKGDIIVTNPPFSNSKSVLQRLKLLDKPFIIILPSSKITTNYFKEYFGNNDQLQIIIPKKRIQFKKLVDGILPENWVDKCNFDCFYYCYKMGLQYSITFL